MASFPRGVIVGILVFAAGCGGEGDTEDQMAPAEFREAFSPTRAIQATNAFYYYKNLEEAWSFYTEVLGFRTVADYEFAKILQVGPTSYLTLVDETQGMHSSEEPKSVTLAVITQEVEGWWAYLSDLGVEMRAPLGSEEGRPHDGFVAIDPEGYLLEFERFNEHPENTDLLPLLDRVPALYPSQDGGEGEMGRISSRPVDLGVQGTVLWLYYEDLEAIQSFYRELLGVEIIVDQGWAKVYPASATGFLGFVDGERGLHQATEEKAVTVSFFTDELEEWLDHARSLAAFQVREPGISSEGGFVRTFVGYDPEGYFLEWDEFLDEETNGELLRLLSEGDGGT